MDALADRLPRARPGRRRTARVFAGLVVAATLLAGACAGPPRPADPAVVLLDPQQRTVRRIEAAQTVWRRAKAEGRDLQAARTTLKEVAWARAEPVELRMRILRLLMDDTSELGKEDNPQLAALMLPLEPRLAVVEYLSATAAERNWARVTPALVRSLAREDERHPIAQRPEFRALRRLHPERTLAEIAFAVFLDPQPPEGELEQEWARRTRADAWDLLRRIDPDGQTRHAMLDAGSGGAGGEEGDRLIRDLRACSQDLGTLPMTGEEVRWLMLLRDGSAPANASWWSEASSAIDRLEEDQRSGLRLRHAEPARWAGLHRPEWLGMSREQLLVELRSRLQGRPVHQRSARVSEAHPPPRERLADWEDELVWGDALAVLVIDEALKSDGVAASLFRQEARDRADRTTEYGGLVLPVEGSSGYRMALYPPRPAQRLGPNQFVASAEMMARSGPALAHYHFHAQRPRNAEFAGPSPTDLEYADRYSRHCLVFTSIRPGVLNIDYYQPGGAIIDLGVITEP